MRVITAALDGDLLAILARADQAFTGRQLARMAGASNEGARQALMRLVMQGIVQREPAGAAQLYRLNREHLAAPAVLALADLRSTLLDRLRSALSEWELAADHASLFGSVARGEERADSDLDICIVRPDAVAADDPAWRAQIATLEREVTRWTGNDTRVLEIAANDDLSADAESVIDDILREEIPLTGEVSALRRLRTLPSRTDRCQG